MMIETFGKSFAIICCVVTSDKMQWTMERRRLPCGDNDMANTGWLDSYLPTYDQGSHLTRHPEKLPRYSSLSPRPGSRWGCTGTLLGYSQRWTRSRRRSIVGQIKIHWDRGNCTSSVVFHLSNGRWRKETILKFFVHWFVSYYPNTDMKCLALEIRIRIITTLNPSVTAELKYFVSAIRDSV